MEESSLVSLSITDQGSDVVGGKKCIGESLRLLEVKSANRAGA